MITDPGISTSGDVERWYRERRGSDNPWRRVIAVENVTKRRVERSGRSLPRYIIACSLPPADATFFPSSSVSFFSSPPPRRPLSPSSLFSSLLHHPPRSSSLSRDTRGGFVLLERGYSATMRRPRNHWSVPRW